MQLLQLGFRGFLRNASIKYSRQCLPLIFEIEAISKRHWNVQNVRHYSLNLSQDLPSLPVAPLQQTLEKYLKAVKPLVSDEEWMKTIKLVEDFGKKNGEGEKLHQIVMERSKNEANWLDEWWSRYAYKKWRGSLVTLFSPGLIYPKQDFGGRHGQIRFASKLLLGIIDYKKMVDSGTLPLQTYGKDPICMKQPYILLNSCRIPGEEEDYFFVSDPEKPEEKAKDITVIHNNQFFSVDLYDDQGNQLNLTQLQDQLNWVVDMSPAPGPPVGMLTAMDRISWAKAYQKLKKDPTNRAVLEHVERSIIVVCLDQPSFHLFPDSITGMAANALHGSGSHLNSGNRWFDKPMQVIVTADGGIGANLEHMLAEAVAQGDILDHALDHMAKRISTKSLPIAKCGPPKKLEFSLSEDLLTDIDAAKQQLDSLSNDMELAPRVFTWYGKDFIKHYKMSPDAYTQVCYQLAFYRLHNQLPGTYETGSLKKFKYGRTDTIHSSTTEALEFCKGMDSKTCEKQEKIELLLKAVREHSRLTQEVMAGEGFDRLLFGMKIAAIENGLDVPSIFKSPAYSEVMRFRLSTSQVPSKHGSNVYFGPSESDGYGLCYNIMKDKVLFTVSAFNNNEITSAKEFADSVEATLKDVHMLLLGRKSDHHKG